MDGEREDGTNGDEDETDSDTHNDLLRDLDSDPVTLPSGP
jgi:hypothetical protein